eukprot:gene12365-biopygen263
MISPQPRIIIPDLYVIKSQRRIIKPQPHMMHVAAGDAGRGMYVCTRDTDDPEGRNGAIFRSPCIIDPLEKQGSHGAPQKRAIQLLRSTTKKGCGSTTRLRSRG